MNAFEENPKLYRKMLEPVPMAEAEENVKQFWEEVYALREKYRIADVHVICKLFVLAEDGREGAVQVDMHAGSENESEGMTAWAFGRAAAQRQMRIAEIGASSASVKSPKNRN
jgi:hypothetical protein